MVLSVDLVLIHERKLIEKMEKNVFDTAQIIKQQQDKLFSTKAPYIKGFEMYIDVESTNDISKGETPYCYEIHITIKDENDNVVYCHSIVITDIFFDKVKMSSAFYRNKIPYYKRVLNPDKNKGMQERKYFSTLPNEETMLLINDLINEYDIHTFNAFNSKFDYQAILNNYSLTSVDYTPFKNLNMIDIRIMFIQLLVDMPKIRKKFLKWCKKNNRLTEKGYASTTVETIIQFIKNNLSFVEKHIGYFDTKNEMFIKKWIIKQYKKYGIDLVITFNNYSLKGYNLYRTNGLLVLD